MYGSLKKDKKSPQGRVLKVAKVGHRRTPHRARDGTRLPRGARSAHSCPAPCVRLNGLRARCAAQIMPLGDRFGEAQRGLWDEEVRESMHRAGAGGGLS